MKKTLVALLLISLYADKAKANLCSDYQPLINGVCDRFDLGCDVSTAPCSTSDGCKTRTFKSNTRPGGKISFCIDPEKEMNFLKVQTKVEEGCGTVTTEVKTKDGKIISNASGEPLVYDERPAKSSIKRPVIISILGRPRPEDFGDRYVPPGPPPEPGGDVCTAPTLYPGDKGFPEVECNRGYLPPLRVEGFPDWLGLTRVGIGGGETHTWCVKLDRDVRTWRMALVDRTGAAQCFYHSAEYIPPAGSGLSSKKSRGFTTGSIGSFSTSAGSFLPRGVWLIKVTASTEYPSCNMQYEVTARE